MSVRTKRLQKLIDSGVGKSFVLTKIPVNYDDDICYGNRWFIENIRTFKVIKGFRTLDEVEEYLNNILYDKSYRKELNELCSYDYNNRLIRY